MKVGVPAEIYPHERRVAATPDTVQKIRKLGLDVVVQAGAGDAAHFSDGAYAEAGATIGSGTQIWHADVVFKVNAPDDDEIAKLGDGTLLVSLLSPAL
ncbi:MAG: H+-translocating transhydrogenase subunit alpha, partial [Myxococcales bacterium]|nr:H+-translocating transhydrogenase subunit alpha [Myxococcales bacterium]